MSPSDFRIITLEMGLGIGILLLLLVDLFLPRAKKHMLGLLALLVLCAVFDLSWFVDVSGSFRRGSYVSDELGLYLKQFFLATGFLAILGGLKQVNERFASRAGEYYLLFLSSLCGMLILSGVRDFLLLVVAFELMSVPLYAMAAWTKKPEDDHERAGEAGFKLYISGAISSAALLFAVTLIIGSTGSTRIAALTETPMTPLLGLGVAMLVGAMGFKIGAVPFHMWVPDTYQGTTTPFAAFLSIGPKVAGLAALSRVLIGGLGHQGDAWQGLVVLLAAASLVVGNMMALVQDNTKRLLAFSGVGHMGVLLMGLAAVIGMESWRGPQAEGLATVLFYLPAYLAGNLGIFLIAERLERNGHGTELNAFRGLGRRSPWLAMASLLFLLSLAGIPFVVGFWAKLYVFLAAWKSGLAWLVILAALVTVIGLFYYLRIVRAMYMDPPETEAPLEPSPSLSAVVILCLAMTVGLGLYPRPLVELCRQIASAFIG